MKKALVWNKDGKIFRIAKASAIDSWTNHQKSQMYTVDIDSPMSTQAMYEIVDNNPDYNLKIEETIFKAEKWTKEGEEDLSVQPMIAERWSDGITTVYSEEEIPVVDGAPDVDFQNFQATNDDSYAYVAAIEYSWTISDDQEKIDAQLAESNLREIITGDIVFGQSLSVDFAVENAMLGIAQDSMSKTVRVAMSEVASAISSGDLYDAIDELKKIPAESKDDKYITDKRLLKYVNKIESHLKQGIIMGKRTKKKDK